jgi:site-specific DNA recombinase
MRNVVKYRKMNAKSSPQLIYGNYCRKSTESEDRQMLSIDSQIDEGKKMADGLGIKITSEYLLTESKSAKVAYKRPMFERMLHMIDSGEINAVIAWHPDRLSRNSIDAARLIEQMDKGKLIEIVTPGQTFKNTPFDKFMFMLQCSQAKMENDKKGVDVKRGLHKKASLGMYPGPAPVGYKNDKYAEKGNKVPLVDEERFPVLRRAVDYILSGKSSVVAQVWKVARDEWGLTMPDGKKISRPTFYRFLSNPFYYGKYEYPLGSGNWYDGIHTPLMNEEEYDKLQFILGKKGKPRPKSHIFDFTGTMRCGECGAAITATIKIKKQQNGNIHRYVYYHCTHRINPNCSQGAIKEEELKRQIVAEIESIEIPPEFHSFAMKWFRKENDKEVSARNTVVNSQQKAYKAVLAKIDGLTDMRAAGEISPEEFTEKRSKYLEEKKSLEKLFNETGQRVDKWIETGDRMFDFIENAKIKFESGSPETKRSILSTLGSDLVIKDKILNVSIEKSLFPLKRVSKPVNEIKKRLEPLNTLEKQREFERLCEQNLVVRRVLDEVRTSLMLSDLTKFDIVKRW